MKTTTSRLGLPILALLATGCAGGGGAEAPAPGPAAQPVVARVQAPPPLPMEPVEFPAFHERTLASGARVIIVENREQPVASISLRIRSGEAAEPRDKAGLAGLMAEVLNKGTRERSAEEIAQAADFIGASLGASAADEWTSVSVTTLTGTLDTALTLLADVTLHPTFPESEVATARQRMLSALQAQLAQPGFVADRRFTEEVWGRHPYGKTATPESRGAIERADLEAFHRLHFRPNNALFVVAGDVDPDDIVARLNRHFGEWQTARVNRPTMFAPPERAQREVVLVHKPASVQAVIRVGHLLPEATDTAWVPLDVATQVLGQPFSGWLFKALRVEKGYGYGAGASSVKKPDRGYFQATTEVRNEVVDSALAELFTQLERIRTEPVPAEDLELVKNFLIGSFPLRIETPQQVAGQVASTLLLGLPTSHLERYREEIAAVDAAAVQRVAQAHLHPDRSVVVVVGDATKIREKLTGFGQVRMFDVDGKPLALADISVGAADVALDASALQPMELVYGIKVQGQDFGTATYTVGRQPVEGRDAVQIISSISSAMINGQDLVAFEAATFEPIHARGAQQMGPNSVKTDLRYEGGRVVGTAALPGQGEKAFDADVPAGTLLPGMDVAVIWLADFEKEKELTLPTFSPQTGEAVNFKIKVTGTKTVTVPAGTFEAYELDVASAEGRMRIYARKDAPHVVLKQEMIGQPVVFELKEIK